MIQGLRIESTEQVAAAGVRPESGPSNGLCGHVTQVWLQAMEAADAQLAIMALKTTRAALGAVFGLLTVLALAAVGICGCVLLDGCAAYALSTPPLPVWVSPMIRGLTYLFISAAGILFLWRSMAGFGDGLSEERTPAAGPELTR